MLLGGVAATVIGVLGAVFVGEGSSLVWLALLAFLGIMFAAGSRVGSSVLSQAKALVAEPGVQMELSVWPYRAGRSLHRTNRVLVTLDEPGSTERSPLGELKPLWSTPAASTATRLADVYGSMSEGQVVLVAALDGSCYLGRLHKLRET